MDNSYRRINHFSEHLNQYNSTFFIPKNVMNLVLKDIKKNNLDITESNIKSILQKHKMNDCSKQIFDKLSKEDPVLNNQILKKRKTSSHEDDLVNYLQQFNGSIYELLCDFFIKISNAFDKGLSIKLYDQRLCFFNYDYLLYKMCETLLECDIFDDTSQDTIKTLMKKIVIIKSREKIIKLNDMYSKTLPIIWKKIEI